MGATDTSQLPDYAPIPDRALGPTLNARGYYVGGVEGNLNCDHIGASLFDKNVTRIGHEETRNLLEGAFLMFNGGADL